MAAGTSIEQLRIDNMVSEARSIHHEKVFSFRRMQPIVFAIKLIALPLRKRRLMSPAQRSRASLTSARTRRCRHNGTMITVNDASAAGVLRSDCYVTLAIAMFR
jgi:hypothetical protein